MSQRRVAVLIAASVAVVLGIVYLTIDGPARRSAQEPTHGSDAATTKPTAQTKPSSNVASAVAPAVAPSPTREPIERRDFSNAPPPAALFGSKSDAARALDDYFAAEASDDPTEYDVALERLMRHRQEALKLLQQAYKAVQADVHKERLVGAIADLRTHAAEPFLADVLREPIQQPPATGEGESDALVLQGVVRYAAMEGLRDLARRGNRAAEDALRDAIVHAHPTLRSEAVAMYLEAGPDLRARQAEVTALLPEDQHYLVHRVNVTRREDLPELPRPPGLGSRADSTKDPRERPPVPAMLGDTFMGVNARDGGTAE